MKLTLTAELKLLLLGGGLFVVILAADTPILSPLRLILALLFVLFVPGYFLQAAVFPRDKELAVLERLALALGASTAALPLAALLLDYLPFTDISLTPIFICEAVYVTLAALASWFRRRRIPPAERFLIRASSDAGLWWQSQDRVNRLLYQVMGVAFLIAGIAALSLIVIPPPSQHLTEFYLIGREGQAEDYPRVVSEGQPMEIQPVIVNDEGAARNYLIQVLHRDQIIAESPMIELADNESAAVPLILNISNLRIPERIEIHLYQPPDLTNSLQLNLWLEPE